MIDEKRTILNYPLLRSNRRSISIKVDLNGQVTVLAPLYAPLTDIQRFVMAKQDWIEQAKQKQQQKKAAVPVFSIGGYMPFLGKKLSVVAECGNTAVLTGNELALPTDAPKMHAQKWLIQQAKEYLPVRIAYWSKVMGLTPSSLTVVTPKTRWGSMKSDGSLRLNAALMHCEPVLIDYVIVHELSHMLHMNHSPAFHAHVARYLPHAETLRKALKQRGSYLTLLREDHDG